MSETVTVPPAPAAAPAAEPGRRLAQERELQNLGAADVARQLKLSVSQVQALETGHYQLLPGPVFVRGFIRNYARLLKLDPEPLLQAIAESLPQPAPRPDMPSSQDIPFPSAPARRWHKYAIATVLIVGGLALYEFYWGESETVVVRPVAMAPSSTPAPLGHTGAAPNVAPAQTESDPADSGATPKSRPGEAEMTDTAATAATLQAAAAAPAGAAPEEARPRPGERQVRLIFDQESWVEIRDRNGKVIFYQLNRPGTERRVNGLPPLSLIVGNARGVRLSYEDKPVDLARHTKVDVARFTLE